MDEGQATERVITQSETRLYRACVSLFTPDSPTSSYQFHDARIVYQSPVPVLDDTGRVIGGASVSRQGGVGCLSVDLVFDYSSPERLDIETEGRVYAHPRGSMTMKSGDIPLSEFDGPGDFRVGSVHLTGIVLSKKRSAFAAPVRGHPA